MQIPLIDLSAALRPGAPRSAGVAWQIRAAGLAAGFFYVREHGIPAALIDRQFDVTKALFDLPLAAKQAVSLSHSRCMRGYEALGQQTLNADSRPDLKESFYCGLPHAADHSMVTLRLCATRRTRRMPMNAETSTGRRLHFFWPTVELRHRQPSR